MGWWTVVDADSRVCACGLPKGLLDRLMLLARRAATGPGYRLEVCVGVRSVHITKLLGVATELAGKVALNLSIYLFC